MSLGGESYLNFMGNEFGHPEWIDFPRDDTYDTSTGAFVPGAELRPVVYWLDWLGSVNRGEPQHAHSHEAAHA